MRRESEDDSAKLAMPTVTSNIARSADAPELGQSHRG